MASAKELAERVLTSELSLYELEDHADADTAAEARRILLEQETEAELSMAKEVPYDSALAERNIENMYGVVHIPVGVAGPVSIDGEAVSGETYVPLATTEGALVASVNRGFSAIREAGGATARVLDKSMTRGPVFRVEDVAEAKEVASWVRENTAALAEAAEATTDHGEFRDVTPHVVGDSVFLRFGFDTKDAMGMNMATIATEAACELVEHKTGAELLSVSGNLCTDKKPAAVNAIDGRGHTVTSDVVLSRELVEDRFNASPEAIEDVNIRKNLIGSAKAGSLGFNAQVANIVCAAFLATGQDAAQVVESANAITAFDVRGDKVYASVTLSSLEVGTIGGGTALPPQSESLDVLGVRGSGDPAGENADALAEIIATAALAGEISLLSALTSHELTAAHEDLGR